MRTLIIVFSIAIILGAGGYFAYTYLANKTTKPTTTSTTSTGQSLSIPTEILQNKYGFLSGGEGDIETIKSYGARWVRPHPGPFLWDAMQKSSAFVYDFSSSDETVRNYQEGGLAVLATLWPFADWDQQSRADAEKCKVSSNDEFLPKNDKKGRSSYLPFYRCSPNDWDSYLKWVKQVVERYDGDGQSDMTGLKIPINYWEVMNEPDLDGGERLDFWKEDADRYAQLLIKTSQAIREADPEAKILIAGAAGGNDQFLGFYKNVFSVAGVKDAFDIANVHCISNDSYQNFNVEPYKKMLEEQGITKPIWVTEAEAMIGSDSNVNASQVYESTGAAIASGAQRIFFTRFEFNNKFMGKEPPNNIGVLPKTKIDGSDPTSAYQTITSLK